jgi:hypothetical protein
MIFRAISFAADHSTYPANASTVRSQRGLSLHDLVRKQSHPSLAFEDSATLELNPLLAVMIMKKASLVTRRDTLLDE